MESQNYQQIFRIVKDYLPKDWKHLCLYFAFTDNMISHKFYVNMGDGYVDCFHLGISREELRSIFFSIDEILASERKQLPKDKRWNVFTMFVSSSGHFDAKYDYEDINQTFVEYEQAWEEKYIKTKHKKDGVIDSVNMFIWDRNFTLNVEYDCYEGEEITLAQVEMLNKLIGHKKWIEKSKKYVKKYCKKDVKNDPDYLKQKNIFSYVMPESIFIEHSDSPRIALMLKYRYDSEHGLAVVFDSKGKITVGIQDIIL